MVLMVLLMEFAFGHLRRIPTGMVCQPSVFGSQTFEISASDASHPWENHGPWVSATYSPCARALVHCGWVDSLVCVCVSGHLRHTSLLG